VAKRGQNAKISTLLFLDLKKFYGKKCPYFSNSVMFSHRNQNIKYPKINALRQKIG